MIPILTTLQLKAGPLTILLTTTTIMAAERMQADL
jgi:hypothetical protein